MHSVVAGRIEDVLERPQLGHGLRVQPEHVQLTQLQVRQEDGRRDADQSQGPVGEPSREGLQQRLAQAGRQREVLGRMVCLVDGPDEVDLVRHAVRPVEAEVDHQEAQVPRVHRVPRQGPEAPVVVEEAVDNDLDAPHFDPGNRAAGRSVQPVCHPATSDRRRSSCVDMSVIVRVCLARLLSLCSLPPSPSSLSLSPVKWSVTRQLNAISSQSVRLK